MNKYEHVYTKLHQIYDKHRRKYKGHNDTKQICLMWSTFRPPDILEGTKPILDIERAFDISLDENQAIEIYDMNLDEAAKRIIELQERE